MNGPLAMILLACCAYAYDLGVNITVKSDYIPDWVYKGEFEN